MRSARPQEAGWLCCGLQPPGGFSLDYPLSFRPGCRHKLTPVSTASTTVLRRHTAVVGCAQTPCPE